jgi:CheY-like chemotaxis protein
MLEIMIQIYYNKKSFIEEYMTKTILVIDDDDSLRELLSTFLKDEGFNVIELSNGETANKVFMENDIDLFIIDVLLPRKNGFKVVEELKNAMDFVEIPIIMISGFYKGYKHKQDAVGNFGALDYLEKPFDFGTDLKPILIKVFQSEYPTVSNSSSGAFVDDDDLFDSPLNINQPASPKLPLPNIPNMPDMKEDEDEDDFIDFPDSNDEEIPDFTPMEKDLNQIDFEERSEVTVAYQEMLKESSKKIEGEFNLRIGLENSLPELLSKLYRLKLKGELYLEDEVNNIKKIIYLENGLPLFIKSTLVSECLGNILVKERFITAKDRDLSLTLMKQTRKPQGKVLREMKCISLENLKYGLIKQLETKLFEVFTWKRFNYKFKRVNTKLNTPPTIYESEYSISYLIYNGIMEGFSIDFIKNFYKRYGKKEILFVPNSIFEFKDGELFDDELNFYKTLNRKESFYHIVKRNPSEKEKIVKQIMAFYYLNMIQFV